ACDRAGKDVGHLPEHGDMHRLQMANPSAKLDLEIVPQVARHFGVANRKVWRALKFHERMTAGRDPLEVKKGFDKDGNMALEFSCPVAPEFVEEAKAALPRLNAGSVHNIGVGGAYAYRNALVNLLNIKIKDTDT